MITIQKGLTNSVVLTLNEKVTLNNPDFILSVKSKLDYTTKEMWLNTDITVNSIRYNEFIIEETELEDLTDQKITLELTDYDYTVWETNSATLSTTYAGNIIQSGKLICTGTASYDLTDFIG